MANRLEQQNNQMIIYTDGNICATTRELVRSELFKEMFLKYINTLAQQDSPILEIWANKLSTEEEQKSLISLLGALAEDTLEQIAKVLPEANHYIDKKSLLLEFVEGFYNCWRSYDRFMVCYSENGPENLDDRPYNTFSNTSERLNHLVRALYRDICEKISGIRPRVYRQIPAGCEVALIAVNRQTNYPAELYSNRLKDVPIIRQVFMTPPVVLSPPSIKRTGQIDKVDKNPLIALNDNMKDWICYPAQVGNLVVFVYFHKKFMSLGCSLANLFEIASDEQVSKGPDAIYLYGVDSKDLEEFEDKAAVYFDDEENNIIFGVVSDDEKMGGFGYLRKMILTLHNIIKIKTNKLPLRGSMIRVELKNGNAANVLLVGVGTAGRRETLESFKLIGESSIRDIRIISDDMGSFEISQDEKLIGYGTEIGAYIQLADFQQGYAFGQIDRAIIMNPYNRNARIVFPITNMSEILKGYPIDIILYTNNYEEIDNRHPTIERFNELETALNVFRDAATMAKGTTVSTGVAHTYYANTFGANDYPDKYDETANKIFAKSLEAGIFVGQIRTRLGIKRFGERGPDVAAEELLNLISSGWNKEV